MSRVFLIRPKKKTDTHLMPHLGLGMLSAMLKARGHEVLVADHMLFQGPPPPETAGLVSDFSPDIIGVSMYTATAGECLRVIDEISSVTDKPVMVGGPHASIYYGNLALNPKISYIFKGEAEFSIAGVVEKSGRPPAPVIIEPAPPDVNVLPYPDFSSFLNRERIKIYPLVTSRGCPFQCSFCVIRQVSTAGWRGRDYRACADEIEKAAQYLKGLELVKISDDCPTLDLARFKAFLREYAGRKIRLPMTIDNARADRIDDEFARLAREAGNGSLCVAVEHGDPEVFGLINKGESLETIKKAAEIIKRNGLELRLCFVIGLPGDSLKKTEASIRLAKDLKPLHIYWNMAHPLKGTRIREWFEKNGAVISDDLDYTSYDTHSLRILEPLVSTADFSREDRKKAYFKAVVETDQYNLNLSEAVLLARQSLRYGYIGIAALSLLRKCGAMLAGKFRGALRRARRLFTRGGRLLAAGPDTAPTQVLDAMPDKKSVPAGLYDRDYFMTNCGGFREFAETRGKVLPERLSCALEAAQIQAGMKVADIGCGRGELVLHAALKGAQALGIDYSQDALKLAGELISSDPARLAEKVRFLKANVNELQLGSGIFDVVFMTDIIEHLYPGEIEAVFRKALEALKPGGRLIAHSAPNIWFCSYGWPVVRRIILVKERLLGTRNPVPKIHPSMTGINEKVHVNLQNPAGLKKTLKSAGFSGVSVFFREQGPLDGKSVWSGALNRLFHSPGFAVFFNISIFAIAKKRRLEGR